jgi:hypothetical protein
MSECRSCGAEIVWVVTDSGKRIPVDAETATEGDTEFEPRAGHVSHFATCPDTNKWRKQ